MDKRLASCLCFLVALAALLFAAGCIHAEIGNM